jgi:hypothetical protein
MCFAVADFGGAAILMVTRDSPTSVRENIHPGYLFFPVQLDSYTFRHAVRSARLAKGFSDKLFVRQGPWKDLAGIIEAFAAEAGYAVYIKRK